MLKKLELESIQAEIGTIDRMLAERDENTDPLGVMQYRLRRQRLLEEISGIESKPETSAEVALYFGGRPVLGSLSSDDIVRARSRAEALEVKEKNDIIVEGSLYFLPKNGRFNLLPEMGGEALVGSLSPEMKELLMDESGHPKREYIGRTLMARLSERTVTERGVRRHVSYLLTGIDR